MSLFATVCVSVWRRVALARRQVSLDILSLRDRLLTFRARRGSRSRRLFTKTFSSSVFSPLHDFLHQNEGCVCYYHAILTLNHKFIETATQTQLYFHGLHLFFFQLYGLIKLHIPATADSFLWQRTRK